MALWAIARRAKRPGGYQPKRGLATAVARTTIEVAGLRPSKPPMGFINRLGRAILRRAQRYVDQTEVCAAPAAYPFTAPAITPLTIYFWQNR